MAFRRPSPRLLRGSELEASLRGVGLRLGTSATLLEEICSPEQVLVSAVAEAIPRDLRTLSVVTTWLEVHGDRLHIAELMRYLVTAHEETADPIRFAAYWSAIAQRRRSDARWAKVARRFAGSPTYLGELPGDLEEAQVARKGADHRFAGSRLRVPRGMLRDRAADVDDPATLARRNHWYRERIRQGSTYRADCWAELDVHPDISPAELARRVGCTYPVARLAASDHRILRGAADSVAA